MEVEEIQTHGHKYRRIGNGTGTEAGTGTGTGNGRIDTSKKGDGQYPADEEEDGEVKRRSNGGGGGSGGGLVVAGVGGGGGGGGLDFRTGRLCGWPSSRIVRVSRASGGKDRHSKVWTFKGLRDRRVRLSVNTAIQFYDLQDRLGYDQPSKAVEWLLKAAASSISELPPIDTSFPDTPKQLSDEKGLDSPKLDMEMDPNYSTQVALPKSACSSNSENSKGSGGLSLSRSESRIKARERARERAKAVEKDKDKESESIVFHHDQLNSNLNTNVSQHAATFTELLTSGMNGNTTSPNTSVGEPNFFNKPTRNYSSPMDYFASSGQIHLGNNPLQQALTTISSPMFSFTGDNHHHHQHQHHHHQEQQFSFLQENFVPVVTTAAGNNSNEYNLNFTISSSSGLAGYNSRGTLQSNSSTPSLLPHIQRFPTIDGSSSQAFFIGSAAAQPNAAVAPMDNHHQHQHHHQQILPGFDARLQLFYDGGGRHSDQKGKGKG